MSKDLTEALRQMMEQRADTNVLPAPQSRGSAPQAKSAAVLPGQGGAGGGIENLTETNFALREYHATGWTTTDGLFTMPAIKKIVLTDTAGTTRNLNFAEPT